MRARTWSIAQVLLLTIWTATWTVGSEANSYDYDAAFQQLKTLVGVWQVENSPSEVSYHLTGNGTALVEEFRGKRGMASVYHMDNRDLRMTHYCSAGNQPRMKATAYDPEKKVLRFEFIDVTNLSHPEAYHTRELEIVFLNENHVELRFNGLDEGEEAPVSQSLIRRR